MSKDSSAAEPLPSRWVPAFAGACLLCVALSFSYVDRRHGSLNSGETTLWMIAVALGFGTGAWQLGRPGRSGLVVCALLSVPAAVIAVFPGFFLYTLLRWLALCLLFLAIVRAPIMRSRKDLYLCLAICFVAACATATAGGADWTMWTYIGPAWIFAGLALTIDYVAGRRLPLWIQMTTSVGFVAVVGIAALVLFLWLPRPPTLGFGFMPTSGADQSPPIEAGKGGGGAGSEPGNAQTPSRAPSEWQQMIDRMRQTTRDPNMPAWQRRMLGTLLDGMSALGPDAAEESSEGTSGSHALETIAQWSLHLSLWWFVMLLCAALAVWWLRRRRYAVALKTLSVIAWALAWMSPQLSMRLSARMIEYCLAWTDRSRPAALTLRERLSEADDLPKTARRWFDEAVTTYYAARFGRDPSTHASSEQMRTTVLNAIDLTLANRD